MNALEIRNLTKSYPGFTLDHLNLTLPCGCILGLIGENGAGKSTAIKLILDMIRKDSGTVTILGRNNAEQIESIKEEIGVVTDEAGIPECLTVEQVGKVMKHTFRNWDEAESQTLYENYYNLMLEYKVTPYDMPFDILDERADAYMSNPRVTSFRVPTCDDDDARLAQIYDKLCSNPVWLAKAYFYPLDEPTSKEMLDQLASLCERLNRIAPEIRICTPFFRNIDYTKDIDQITFMTDKTTLWCPKSYMYITSNIYSAAQKEKYPSFGERMAERKAAGDDVWWYVCWEPGDPYNNMFVDQLGVQHRILFWQQYAHGVDGFLYWAANYWDSENGTLDPWSDIATVKNLSEDVYGDGSLLYSGSSVGLDTACPSLRLAAIRDGVEDYNLFVMAAELLGDDFVNEKIAEVTESLIKYTTDTDVFLAVRKSVYEAIEKAVK